MTQAILLVDDEEDFVEMVSIRLKENGFNVVTAANGQEALGRTKEVKFHLIISDVVMPEMDGFAFFKEIRGNKATTEIPFIVVTGRTKMEDSFRALGVDDFLVKPLEPAVLMERVNALVTQGEATAPESTPAAETPKEEEKEPPKEEAPVQEAAAEPVQTTETAEAKPAGPKVLVAGNNPTLNVIQQQLKGKEIDVEAIENVNDLVMRVVEFRPALVVLDVLINNKPSNTAIASLRKSSDFKELPIVVYTYLDKENLGDISVPQRTMDIDRAKTACLESGATAALGGFDESNFVSNVSKYLNVN